MYLGIMLSKIVIYEYLRKLISIKKIIILILRIKIHILMRKKMPAIMQHVFEEIFKTYTFFRE